MYLSRFAARTLTVCVIPYDRKVATDAINKAATKVCVVKSSLLNPLSLTPSRLPRFSANVDAKKGFFPFRSPFEKVLKFCHLAEKRGSLEGVSEREFKAVARSSCVWSIFFWGPRDSRLTPLRHNLVGHASRRRRWTLYPANSVTHLMM